MDWTPKKILSVLDRCNFTMLDNGYIYLAATRLSLHRSDNDWALVIEVFGFSPRYGMPTIYIDTFASSLHNRPKLEQFCDRKSYDRHLTNFPYSEGNSNYYSPTKIANTDWRNWLDSGTL